MCPVGGRSEFGSAIGGGSLPRGACVGAIERELIPVLRERLGSTDPIGIYLYLAAGLKSKHAKHRRVARFVRVLRAFKASSVQVVHVANLLRMVDPIHVHVKIPGNNGDEVGLRHDFGETLNTTC